EIAAFARDSRKTVLPQPEALTALSARRNFQPHVSFKSRYFNLSSERCLPRRDLHVVNQITSFNRKVGMLGQTHPQKKITALSATRACLAMTGEANTLAFRPALPYW